MKRVEGVHAFGKNYLKSRNSGDDNANHEGKKVVNHLLHMSKKKRNLRRKTELLLSRHPEKQFVKEKSDLQIRCAKILASGSRRDKQAIARLRRFRIQQSVKGLKFQLAFNICCVCATYIYFAYRLHNLPRLTCHF